MIHPEQGFNVALMKCLANFRNCYGISEDLMQVFAVSELKNWAPDFHRGLAVLCS